jgi:hypothetical protein
MARVLMVRMVRTVAVTALLQLVLRLLLDLGFWIIWVPGKDIMDIEDTLQKFHISWWIGYPFLFSL